MAPRTLGGKRRKGDRNKKRKFKRFKPQSKYQNYGDYQTQMIIKSPSAVADTALVRMKYSLTAQRVTTITPGQYLIRGNSLNDPDWTGTGHQPLSFDEWSNFYTKYCVLGCGYEVNFIGDGSVNTQVAVICKPNTAAITNFDTIKERSYSNYRICGLQGSNKHIQKLSGYMSTKKMFGLKDVMGANDTYSAAVGSNPLFEWYIHLYTQAVDRTTSATCNIEGIFTFYVKMYDRANLLQS